MRVAMMEAKKRLAVVWCVGGGLLFLLLLGQTILGHYGDKVKEAWAWLLPTIIPSLSMIVSGVVVSGPLGKKLETKTVDRFAFKLAFSISLFYLVTVSFTILLSPFSQIPPLELMKLSNLWLGPFQGLVGAALAVFFVSTK